MLPKIHIILGAIFSILFYFIFQISLFHASLIFFSSFLIDFDHYLYYIIAKKDLSLKNSYKWFVEKRRKILQKPFEERKKYKHPVLIFHGIEFWIVILLLGFIYHVFLFILIGIGIHMILDFVDLISIKEPFYSKLSQIIVIIKNKNLLSI